MKILGFFSVLLTGCLFIYGSFSFAPWGDASSPASLYLSPYYIENSLRDTATPNMVTAILGDYRGYDTMFETAVIYTAAIVCFMLLRKTKKTEPKVRLYRHKSTGLSFYFKKGVKVPENSNKFQRIDVIWAPHDIIVKITCGFIIPFIQLFGLYVIAHGHYSPGGGFQGGVILGASIILFAIAHDLRSALKRLSEKVNAFLSFLGIFLYVATGLLCMLLGGEFLDYSQLKFILPSDAVMSRSYGILIVEIGVAMSVMTVMIWLYNTISSAGTHDEGL